MMKIGLSKEELKDILASTLRWVFVVPFMTALVISWIIIAFINRISLTSYTNLAVACSGIYLLVEWVLYIIIKRKYQKKIFENI